MTGKELKAFREQLGLSQEEFGLYLGYDAPQTTISMLENDHHAIRTSLEVTIKLWKKLLQLAGRFDSTRIRDARAQRHFEKIKKKESFNADSLVEDFKI